MRGYLSTDRYFADIRNSHGYGRIWTDMNTLLRVFYRYNFILFKKNFSCLLYSVCIKDRNRLQSNRVLIVGPSLRQISGESLLTSFPHFVAGCDRCVCALYRNCVRIWCSTSALVSCTSNTFCGTRYLSYCLTSTSTHYYSESTYFSCFDDHEWKGMLKMWDWNLWHRRAQKCRAGKCRKSKFRVLLNS